jgi:hypothetical protein
MSVASSARLRAGFRHPFLLATIVGIAILAVALWVSGSIGRWISSGGPFVEFEIRLPAGILLPPDRNIEMTFWSGGFGRGCRVMGVRRSNDPPDIVGKCNLIAGNADSAMSLRFSRFAEGFWRVPIENDAIRNPDFGPWQRIEFIWAPVGERKVSSLPHGDYYFRYLVRP